METVFDINKKYTLWILREQTKLMFTGVTKVKLHGETLITFFDKYGQQQVFPLETLTQAKEEIQ